MWASVLSDLGRNDERERLLLEADGGARVADFHRFDWTRASRPHDVTVAVGAACRLERAPQRADLVPVDLVVALADHDGRDRGGNRLEVLLRERDHSSSSWG